MMGIKERAFGPLPPVSLEDLVPPDHFYRHLERTLDLGFTPILLTLPFVTDLAGNVFDLFDTVEVYDDIMHFLNWASLLKRCLRMRGCRFLC